MNNTRNVLKLLKNQYNPKNIEGMARYGITTANAYGIPMPFIRDLAKKIGRDHDLAIGLWDSGIHEARILAALVDDPQLTTARQMDSWAEAFDSWDVCDQVCSNLFDKTPWAREKAERWSADEQTFVKRAGFVLMAALAVHDKKAEDKIFLKFLPIIKRESMDERNFVRKAVNWALRQIGKRNVRLHREAIRAAEKILAKDSPSSRWIARDALKELKDPAVSARLKR
jgi:3-methyladenine DNA glycosylase AlkD